MLCQLGDAVQTHVISQRVKVGLDQLSGVSSYSESDTIYSIDKFSEEALLEWFSNSWPEDFPVEVIAEGLEEHGHVVFPTSTQIEDTRYKIIIDPIDGTRELMYDKRSAWVLAGIAEQKFFDNSLTDIEVAMMTEIPISKQTLADQISGFRGCGRSGLVATRSEIGSMETNPLTLAPSTMKTMEHGVGGFVKFFPEGKELIARLETDLWKRLDLFGENSSPVVFDDQYISTGGQMYGLIIGHYRFYGDIRPQVLTSLGLGHTLTCHPYDAAAGLLLQEAGCIYESPEGAEVDAPLDTVTPVSWVGYANRDLAASISSIMGDLMEDYFPSK